MRAQAGALAASCALALAAPAALEARLAAQLWLDTHSLNSHERGWLAAGIRGTETRLRP